MDDRKTKTLPSTLRGRKRYLTFKVHSDEKFGLDDLSIGLWNSLMNTLGELGSAKASAWIMRDTYDEKSQTGIVRCSHTSVEEVRAALALIQKVGEIQVSINVLGVSGTIKASRQKFFGERDLTSFAQ